PVNSRRIAPMAPTGRGLLEVLALTVANRESLGTWSPPPPDAPGVLFCADCDRRGVKSLQSIPEAIVTAPHHGSDANANAYALVQQWAGPSARRLTWVRSDCRSRSRPGPSYLHVAGRRLCTICRWRSAGASLKCPVRLSG